MIRLQSSSTTTTLAAGRIGGDGGNIFNTANLHASTSQSTERSLSTWTKGLRALSASSSHLNMQGSDTQFFASMSMKGESEC